MDRYKLLENRYETLRKEKNKELEIKQLQINRFIDKTYKLLKGLGLSDREILDWYRREIWN